MDGNRFDRLVKSLAQDTSRRSVIKGIAGGAVGGALGLFRIDRSSAAPASKVGICHKTGSATNPVVYIVVSSNAIPAHKAHGDVINPDFQNDPANCGGCSISCDDGDPCTTDTCVAGSCVHTPIDCSSLNDQCLSGACVDGNCVAQPAHEGESCDDGDACTEKDTCVSGRCVGSPVNCDDGNVCTTETCDSSSGCIYTKVDGCCNLDSDCDDGDSCTIDTCVSNACVNTPVACNVGQACVNGECIGCAGGTCDNLPFGCEGDNGCVCFITTEGTGFCHRSEPCAGLQTCTTSADCTDPSHPACSTATCCGDIHVCIRPCAGTSLAPTFGPQGPMTAG